MKQRMQGIYTYLRKVMHHPAKMATNSGQGPSLENLHDKYFAL